MSVIFEKDAADHVCPWNSFQPCVGAKCMAWAWVGPRADRCETDNLCDTEEGPRPIGAPRTPEGEGWEMDGPTFQKGYHRSDKDKLPKATAQRWIKRRPNVDGCCARGGQDQGGYW